MPGSGSHGSASTAREVASSFDPRRWFMGHGVGLGWIEAGSVRQVGPDGKEFGHAEYFRAMQRLSSMAVSDSSSWDRP
jgi:hypothetical protein